MKAQQLDKIRTGAGFIAALDQSGGSTPKALQLYGVEESEYSNEAEMFDLMHQMRVRMITSRPFDGRRILGAILFEGTMDREVEGVGTAEYLWSKKGVVPFLKVDKGLEGVSNGVQLMKDNPDLESLLQRAIDKGIFGTKMRSVIKESTSSGIDEVVRQQFDVARRIIARGLVPIIEPEVDIHCPDKSSAESILLESLHGHLDALGTDNSVMLKLTLPEQDNLYQPLVQHKTVARVVALSGGYSRQESNDRLRRNTGVIASFSRALTEGLSARQSDDDFEKALDSAIQSIFDASTIK